MYSRIVGLPEAVRAKYKLDSMRVLISSSAPLLTQTKDEILRCFPRSQLNEFYGSTEAGIVTNLKPRDQRRKVRSVGQPVFGVQVKVINDEGREVQPGEVGELWSLGACFKEYYAMPEATTRAFRDGWFSAGDLARVDEEGYVYIVDRRTDLIISGGENIYPAEVEDALLSMPGVAELAIIGVPHGDWGETVHAVVVPQPDATLTLADLHGFCEGRLAKYKRPRSLELVDALPKTATGKVLRRKLKDAWLAAADVTKPEMA
jgi:long-chain acyl-CoA synthetase